MQRCIQAQGEFAHYILFLLLTIFAKGDCQLRSSMDTARVIICKADLHSCCLSHFHNIVGYQDIFN